MITLVNRWLNRFQPKRDKADVYTTLVQEELKELNDEPTDIKEACDLVWVAIGKALQHCTMLELQEGLAEVYDSNMSKASRTEEEVREWIRINGMQLSTTVEKLSDGTFVAVREDGKILKGPNYRPANL